MREFEKKVRYVAGNGVRLAFPLKNGLDSFEAGIVYTITDVADYKRLMSRNDFEDVTPKPAVTPKKPEPIKDSKETE